MEYVVEVSSVDDFGGFYRSKELERCRDCKWHVRIKRLAWGNPHRCMYGSLCTCAEIVRKHGGICLWYEKEANDD